MNELKSIFKSWRLLVIGYQLSVVGCRLSVVGYRLSVVGYQFSEFIRLRQTRLKILTTFDLRNTIAKTAPNPIPIPLASRSLRLKALYGRRYWRPSREAARSKSNIFAMISGAFFLAANRLPSKLKKLNAAKCPT